MRKRLPPPVYPAVLAAQLTAFWQGMATLEQKYKLYFTSTPSRRGPWQAPQPSTLTENLVLQCTKGPVRLSLHPLLPEEIAQETRALFEQLFAGA